MIDSLTSLIQLILILECIRISLQNIQSNQFITINHYCLMKEYIISIFLILIALFVYKLILVPRKIFYTYLKNLEKMGYKVFYTPFTPLAIPFMKIIEKDKNEGDALKVCKTIYRDHDVILTNSIHKIVLDFSHPDFIKDFYSAQHLYTYPKLQFATAPIVRAMGRGIPFSQGEQWKRKRRIINAVFNFDFIKSMTPEIEKVCDKAIKDVEQTAMHTYSQNNHIVEYDIIDLTVRMFSSVVMECFFGGATDQKIEGQPVCVFINKLIADVTMQAFQLLPSILGSRFTSLGLRSKDRDSNRRIALFRSWGLEFIQKKINIARENIKKEGTKGQPKDLIQALVRANIDGQLKNQDIYSDKQILQQFSTFFVAGTDTTSHYVMTMIYFIVQNPQVQAKLRQQIDKFMKTEDYSHENLKNLSYIDWIQKQTSRMYGPVTGVLMRQTKQDNFLNSLPIKKGTYVTIQHLGSHYSQKYFKDPLVFRPERWQSQCNEIPPFVLGGFSAGPRTCIGKHLVLIESKIGLIKFMKRYKKVVIPEGPLKWVIKFVYTPEYFKSKMIIDE